MNDSKRLGYFLMLATVAGLLFLRTYFDQNKIRDHHIIVCGEITEMMVSKTLSIKYQYTFRNKIFYNDGGCTKETENKYREGFKKILIALELGDPKNNVLLENSVDFARYNITQTDTTGINCYK